jgi:hypothetical protein
MKKYRKGFYLIEEDIEGKDTAWKLRNKYKNTAGS